ncbi:ATP-binding protein, partial [Escherichia coli]
MTNMISYQGLVRTFPNEVRTHCVSVRLNEEELSILDSKRGPYKKGEWLRMASLNKL